MGSGCCGILPCSMSPVPGSPFPIGQTPPLPSLPHLYPRVDLETIMSTSGLTRDEMEEPRTHLEHQVKPENRVKRTGVLTCHGQNVATETVERQLNHLGPIRAHRQRI